MRLTNYDIAKTIRDLLRIAEVAMPREVYESDPRVLASRAMLDRLQASQHRPPLQVARDTDRAAQPESTDLVLEVLAKLDTVPPPDLEVSAALDAYLRTPGAPALRHHAIESILRDWFVGHGYIEHREAVDPYH